MMLSSARYKQKKTTRIKLWLSVIAEVSNERERGGERCLLKGIDSLSEIGPNLATQVNFRG